MQSCFLRFGLSVLKSLSQIFSSEGSVHQHHSTGSAEPKMQQRRAVCGAKESCLWCSMMIAVSCRTSPGPLMQKELQRSGRGLAEVGLRAFNLRVEASVKILPLEIPFFCLLPGSRSASACFSRGHTR